MPTGSGSFFVEELTDGVRCFLWNSAVVPIEENSRKTVFLARKIKTRREFLGNLDLTMNLMVNGSFWDGACGKWGSGQDQDPTSAI